MVISDFYVVRACFTPHKTNPVLFINANAVFGFSVSRKILKPITGRNFKFL